jgi:hypothetical protein
MKRSCRTVVVFFTCFEVCMYVLNDFDFSVNRMFDKHATTYGVILLCGGSARHKMSISTEFIFFREGPVVFGSTRGVFFVIYKEVAGIERPRH